MRVALTVSFVSLITCSFAVPVPVQPGDITLVKSKNFLDQDKTNAPNAVWNANGKRRPGQNAIHKGVVTDGPGPNGDFGVAHASHNLPTDAFPHQADAHPLHPGQFDPGTKINVGTPLRAMPADMNPKGHNLGSLGSKEFGDLKDKMAAASQAGVTKAPLPKGSKDDVQVKSKAAPAPVPKNKAPLAPLPALHPAVGGKKGSKTV
jgi:hypothetical protein